jgi:hypothetical protein
MNFDPRETIAAVICTVVAMLVILIGVVVGS